MKGGGGGSWLFFICLFVASLKKFEGVLKIANSRTSYEGSLHDILAFIVQRSNSMINNLNFKYYMSIGLLIFYTLLLVPIYIRID